jgi:hypothetical protein
VATVARRFPIRFSGANRALALLGITRSQSYIECDADRVRVRMGWAFAASMPRSSVRTAAPDHGKVWGWGAHGWRGVWLVNGSSHGIVRIELDPPQRARVLVIRVRLTVLRIAVDEPDHLIAALTVRDP